MLSVASSVEIDRIADVVDQVERRGHGACFHKTGLQQRKETHISKELFSDFMVYQVGQVSKGERERERERNRREGRKKGRRKGAREGARHGEKLTDVCIMHSISISCTVGLQQYRPGVFCLHDQDIQARH